MSADAGQGALKELVDDHNAFSFFQAVRLLQRLRPDRAPVGGFGDPKDEVVRFTANPSLSFPASEIQDLEDRPDEPWQMMVNFMGLVGHMGVLPNHYSVLATRLVRSRDPGFMAFLDLFHHRLISLFYLAWERGSFFARYERGEPDLISSHLADLLGFGQERIKENLDIDPASLMGYTGLLGPGPRSATALEQMIGHYFEVPVEVEQFLGSWYLLADVDHCRIDEDGVSSSTRLGGGAVVGDEVWDPQARVRIVLGPLDWEEYESFLPSGSAFGELRSLLRFFTNDQFDVELRLVLDRQYVPTLVLGSEEPTCLGWGTWIRSVPFVDDAGETVLML